MNLLTIIILLVLLVFAINGYMRGFARTLTSLLFFVFSGVLVYYSTPYVNDFLKTQTPVYSFVESKCETLVEDAIMDKLDKETQKFAQQSDVPRKDQNKIIKSGGSDLFGIYFHLSGGYDSEHADLFYFF